MEQAVSDKPREFWICDAENDDHETGCFVSYKRLSDEEKDNNGVFNQVHVIEYAAFEKVKAENERLREYNRERFLEFIGVDPKNTCPGCGGIGEKCYSSTATWGGGIGGQALTNAVCDKCWGSGDAARPWANLKQIRIQQQVLTKERDALKAENERLKSKLSIADLKTHKEKTLRILALLNECDTLKAKLAEVEAELDNKRGAMMLEIKRLHELADRELEAAKVMREALCSIEGGDARDEKEAGEIARTAIAKADEIRGKE